MVVAREVATIRLSIMLKAVLTYRAMQDDNDKPILQPDRLERNAFVKMLYFITYFKGRLYGAIVRIVEREDLNEMLVKVISYVRDMLQRI